MPLPLLGSSAHCRLGRVRSRDVCDENYFKSLNWEGMVDKSLKAPYVPSCNDHMDVSNFERSSKKLEIDQYEAYTGDNEWCKEFDSIPVKCGC